LKKKIVLNSIYINPPLPEGEGDLALSLAGVRAVKII
jgi:hypothetical protein